MTVTSLLCGHARSHTDSAPMRISPSRSIGELLLWHGKDGLSGAPGLRFWQTDCWVSISDGGEGRRGRPYLTFKENWEGYSLVYNTYRINACIFKRKQGKAALVCILHINISYQLSSYNVLILVSSYRRVCQLYIDCRAWARQRYEYHVSVILATWFGWLMCRSSGSPTNS
jgi:hypothetical protein